MLIAKVQTKRSQIKFVEILRQGTVQFDPRPGWVLVKEPGVRPRRTQPEWLHPDDVLFFWVREFNFGEKDG